MNKSSVSLAIAILLSLGISACSSSAGSNASEGSKNYTPSTSSPVSSGKATVEAMNKKGTNNKTDSKSNANNTTDNASNSNAINNSSNGSDSSNTTDNNNVNNNGSNNNSNNTSGVTISDSTPKVFSSLAHSANTTSQLYKYLNDMQSLKTAMESAQKQTESSCTNSAKSYDGACSKTTASGTVMLKHEQAYSSYAVIREESSNKEIAANSYIAMVTSGTPGTNKASALNASYSGKAAYSLSKSNAVTSVNFKLDINNNGEIVGTVYTGSDNSGTAKTFATFDNGNIHVDNGYLTFKGNATFKISTKDTESGSYQGYFAGNNAEEVVGTFETNADAKKEVQGAFAGSKQ